MITDFFNSTAVVYSLSGTKTGMGGISKNYTTERISSLPCRISKRYISEVDELGKRTIRERFRLYCKATSANRAITESDRIEVDSKTWEVVGIYNPGLLNKHLEIDIVEVR
jgi:hypothetical protein